MPQSEQSKEKRPIGFGQLSLVEHSLCPLDRQSSLVENLVHQAEYRSGETDPPPLTGDFTGDGATDRRDVAVLVGNFGRRGDSHRGLGDVDGDRRTSLVDLALLQTNFAAASPSPSSAPAASPLAADAVFAQVSRSTGRERLASRITLRQPRRPVGETEAERRDVPAEDATSPRAGRRLY